MVSCSPLLFTLLFACYHLETSIGVSGHCIQQCQIHVDNNSTLWQHNRFHRLSRLEVLYFHGCLWMCGREMQLAVPDHCILVITEFYRHHLRHLCILCSVWRIRIVKYWCLYQSTFQGIECCMVTWCPVNYHIMTGKCFEGFCYPNKFLMDFQVVVNKAKECSYLFSIWGDIHKFNSCCFEGSGFKPVVLRPWPKYWISLAKK